jgi:chemotaxis protein MotB
MGVKVRRPNALRKRRAALPANCSLLFSLPAALKVRRHPADTPDTKRPTALLSPAMAKKDNKIQELTAPFWMATFSDMVTLLLTFFVMLVAMSEVKVEKFKEALSYFQGRTGVMQFESAVPAVQPPAKTDASAAPQNQASVEMAMRYEELLAYIEANNLSGLVDADLTEDGMHFVINDAAMFNPGQAEIIEPSRTLLRLIANLLTDDVQAIVVEGHTDDRAIQTARFPSNWELSAARASSVVRLLLSTPSALPPQRYTALGMAEHHPIDTNDTAEGRGRNRRVEIFFRWTQWQT